ncbi:hypothetical protein CPC16_005682 [Podila verticillata]|nr:hypothetical protein CPC16_005682 [Podila verticillata]
MNQQDIEKHIASEVRRLQGLRRIADQRTASLIQTSRASIFSPMQKQEVVVEEANHVPSAQSDVVDTHAGPSSTPFWSLPIPDPDVPPAYTDTVEEAVMMPDVDTPQRNMAAMKAQHPDLPASLERSKAPSQGHTSASDTVPETPPEEVQEASEAPPSMPGAPSGGSSVPRPTNALLDSVKAYAADSANEAVELLARVLAELQEQYDMTVAENEELRAENQRLMEENLGLMLTVTDKSRVADMLMDEKAALEEVLAERDGQLVKQKEKYSIAKRTIAKLSQGSNEDDPSGEEPVTDGITISLIEEASEQLRHTVDEYKDQHAILRAEIRSLEEQKAQLLLDVDMFSLHSEAPFISSRPSGDRVRGEREFLSDEFGFDNDHHHQSDQVEESLSNERRRGRPASMAEPSSTRQMVPLTRSDKQEVLFCGQS